MVRNFITDTRGLTLIDLAIGLAVLGILLVPLAKIMDQKNMQNRRDTTIGNAFAIQIALDQYYFDNDNYPCPALITANSDDDENGEAAELPAPVPPGSPCAAAVQMPNGIMVGAVPYKSLKIPKDVALDGWKNKLTYIISAELTRKDVPFDQTAGAITVKQFAQDAQGECIAGDTDLTTSAHWTIVSHGVEGIGGYTAEGTLIQACPDGGSATVESENCDYANNAVFREQTCAYNLNEDDQYYDDRIMAKDRIPTRIWSNSPEDNTDILSNVDTIGINNEDNTKAVVPLDVAGNIRADADPADVDKTGFAKTKEICDTDDGNCFDPELIGGDKAEMQCDTADSSALSGIGSKKALCGVTFDILNGSCPNGSYMSGIQADGSPTCI